MKFTVANNMKSVSNRTDIVKDIQFKPFESDQPFGGQELIMVEEFVSDQMDIFG